MIEYKIVKVIVTAKDDALSKLEQEVNNFLEQGWKLQGGVSIYPLNYNSNREHLFALLQTMTKEKEPEIDVPDLTDPKIISKLIEQYNYFHKEKDNE